MGKFRSYLLGRSLVQKFSWDAKDTEKRKERRNSNLLAVNFLRSLRLLRGLCVPTIRSAKARLRPRNKVSGKRRSNAEHDMSMKFISFS